MLLMLPSLGRAQEESEAVTDSVPVPSWKGVGKLWNHLQNCASRTRYLEASNMEPAGTCSSMNTVSGYTMVVETKGIHTRRYNVDMCVQHCFCSHIRMWFIQGSEHKPKCILSAKIVSLGASCVT